MQVVEGHCRHGEVCRREERRKLTRGERGGGGQLVVVQLESSCTAADVSKVLGKEESKIPTPAFDALPICSRVSWVLDLSRAKIDDGWSSLLGVGSRPAVRGGERGTCVCLVGPTYPAPATKLATGLFNRALMDHETIGGAL